MSAKILSGPELKRLDTILPSVRSGIGNAMHRVSAQRHIDLMQAYGMRRSESTHLRTVDAQQDACRVQAYGEHTLKTAWSNRLLPLSFAPPATQDWVDEAVHEGREQLIDADARQVVDPDSFYDALSQLIKAITRDKSMGSHHLRHTLVSRMVLSLLWEQAGLEAQCERFPWLKGLKVEAGQVSALLGTEGDAGQGLRALAGLVGHSHPNTTLRSYTHVLCVALRGVLDRHDTLDISHSFEHRVASRATWQRLYAKLSIGIQADAMADMRRRSRAVRDRIERQVGLDGIDVDPTPLPVSDALGLDDSEPTAADAVTYYRIEEIHRSLHDHYDLAGSEEVERSRRGLEKLALIRTGKRGGSQLRHVLDRVTHLPPDLRGGTAPGAATSLCRWLEHLRCHDEPTFRWLLSKWKYASEQERGRMRLSGDEEVERARSLYAMPEVRVTIKCASVSKRDRGKTTKPVARMRIRCLDKKDGRPLARDTTAVRWVMTHVVAAWGD